MPDGTFVKAVEDLAIRSTGPVEIEGITYDVRCLKDPRQPAPLAECLSLGTLGAIVAYISTNHDDVDPGSHFLHVQGPQDVVLYSSLNGHFRMRERPVRASYDPRVAVEDDRGRSRAMSGRFLLNRFVPLDEFLIGLRSCFAPVSSHASLLKLLGNVKEEAVSQFSDDGVTQEVVSRKGRNLRDTTCVPNPVRLAPFRTFPEVDQAVSDFILRLRGGGDGELPEAALFEADGGAWVLDAVAKIREFLVASLGDSWTVLA